MTKNLLIRLLCSAKRNWMKYLKCYDSGSTHFKVNHKNKSLLLKRYVPLTLGSRFASPQVWKFCFLDEFYLLFSVQTKFPDRVCIGISSCCFKNIFYNILTLYLTFLSTYIGIFSWYFIKVKKELILIFHLN